MCDHHTSKVVNTIKNCCEVKRRRMCCKCGERFTTYEISRDKYRIYREALDTVQEIKGIL